MRKQTGRSGEVSEGGKRDFQCAEGRGSGNRGNEVVMMQILKAA